MRKKTRADQLLYEQGLAESREQAKRLIMAGRVRFVQEPAGPPIGKSGALFPSVQGLPRVPVDKPGRLFPSDARFAVTPGERFVGRGAYKLLTAIEHFSLDVTGFVVLDAGASTGGFTDCLLQHGAARVYAADVGRNQLHERLRADARVILLEGVNLRLADASLVPEDLDMVTADLSFISLTLVLGPCTRRLKNNGLLAALIKPQFEAGPGATVRGVVRDPAVRDAAVDKILAFARDTLDVQLLGIVPSAVKGAEGNQEYMAVWRKNAYCNPHPVLSAD
ncbi:MAG: TlyA family RNA methyltransferase [Desulfovibrio sp.]|jgi:23S rRNA (cytidine1920-2'-O)/16S rRNA (cytidine1409-2'-O)-methyltransferase|nr:TlyA family RNA methyltransferase [Desulfovibrio sp.]